MKTTQLYIELIIIGLETFIWMSIFLINSIGYEIGDIIINVLNEFSTSLLLIGILYIIGILIDRLVDMIFQKREDKIREQSGLQIKSSFLLLEKYNIENYADYSRSRIRILRASIFNIPLIVIAFLWYVNKYVTKSYLAVIYILVIGIFFTYLAWKSYNLTVKKYYDKVRILEMGNESESN